MAVTPRDLLWQGQAGGGPDITTVMTLGLFGGPVRVFSSDPADDGFPKEVGILYRDRDSQGQFSFTIVPAGQDAAEGGGADVETVLAVVPNFSPTGDLMVANSTPDATGTLQAGSASVIQLEAGESAVDDFWAGCVGRIAGGWGAGQVFAGATYNGATKELTLLRDLDVAPDNTSVYELYRNGAYIPRGAAGLWDTVQSPFFIPAGSPGDIVIEAPTVVYAQTFLVNAHPTDTITAVVIKELLDPDSRIDFALDPAINGSGDPQPDDGDFDSLDKNVPGGSLGPGDYIGVWLRLTTGALRGRSAFRMGWEGDDGL